MLDHRLAVLSIPAIELDAAAALLEDAPIHGARRARGELVALVRRLRDMDRVRVRVKVRVRVRLS